MRKYEKDKEETGSRVVLKGNVPPDSRDYSKNSELSRISIHSGRYHILYSPCACTSIESTHKSHMWIPNWACGLLRDCKGCKKNCEGFQGTKGG